MQHNLLDDVYRLPFPPLSLCILPLPLPPSLYLSLSSAAAVLYSPRRLVDSLNVSPALCAALIVLVRCFLCVRVSTLRYVSFYVYLLISLISLFYVYLFYLHSTSL